ncbi:RimK family alpha-L-glutamate ligase [Haloarchaeobius sp. TZWSO28]|uniref:RimK family alpha-L-glutamate ligase n=1 Tax=Haloarchaeobius sp. TZWSO28 TaxID=3446119 RepID=UPI003EC0517E
MDTSESVRVGVLSLHNSKESKAICNAVEELGHQPEWLREQNTTVRIREEGVTLEPDVDVIANRMLLSNTEQPCEELGLANTLNSLRPMLNEPPATLRATHKIATAAALSDNGIRVPEAFLALNGDNLNAVRDEFGEEAVYKTAIGTHGGGTWKVGPDERVNAKVGNRYAFLQKLIDRDGERHRDIRVYVVGDQVVGAMYRYAPDNDWRTNVALGGEVQDATKELPEKVRKIAKRSADIVGLDYAGVDIVEGDNGWYVLEVNPTAGFKGLYQATNRSPAPYIAKLAIEKAGGEVDDERVRELSATLDDSWPSCAPREVTDKPEKPVIVGYTEQVVVSGTSDNKTVIAKSDTGATRTSIDTGLAADIGAGPIKSVMRVKSGSLKQGKSRPVVDLVVGVGGQQHTVTASVEDRSHMDYPILLGRDILQNYQVDVSKRADKADDDEREEEEEALE